MRVGFVEFCRVFTILYLVCSQELGVIRSLAEALQHNAHIAGRELRRSGVRPIWNHVYFRGEDSLFLRPVGKPILEKAPHVRPRAIDLVAPCPALHKALSRRAQIGPAEQLLEDLRLEAGGAG